MKFKFCLLSSLLCLSTSSASALDATDNAEHFIGDHREHIKRPIFSGHVQDYYPAHISWKIAQTLGTSTKANPFNPEETEKKLTELTQGRSANLKLTLSSKGKIRDIVVLESSGSSDIDKKLQDLIASASPYGKNLLTDKDRSYQITLPNLRTISFALSKFRHTTP